MLAPSAPPSLHSLPQRGVAFVIFFEVGLRVDEKPNDLAALDVQLPLQVPVLVGTFRAKKNL